MWLFFTLATTLIWGLAELFYKKGARPDEKYSHLKIIVCVGVVMGLHAVFVLITEGLAYDPKNLLLYGMRFVEESISDPIENTSGALVALMCAVILHESIDAPSIAAILIILVGILGVGFLDTHGDTDRSKKLGKKMAFVAFAMPFCYAIIDAVGSFLDIYWLDIETTYLTGVTEDNIELIANTSYEFTFLIVAIILFIFMKIRKVKFELPTQRDKILAAVFETAGQFTYVYAMSGNGAIAAPIISSVCVVSLVLSRIFLKEKLTAKQYIFIFMVIIGIIILAVVEGDA